MQLESQVGAAASYLANRDNGNTELESSTLSETNTTLLKILQKLDQFTQLNHPSPTPISIHNNCTSRTIVADCSSQTEPDFLPDAPPGIQVQTTNNASIEEHVQEEEILTCTICHSTFPLSSQLDRHLELDHEITKEGYSPMDTSPSINDTPESYQESSSQTSESLPGTSDNNQL